MIRKIKIAIISIIIIISSILTIIGTLLLNTRKTLFLMSEKKNQVAQIGGRGGLS